MINLPSSLNKKKKKKRINYNHILNFFKKCKRVPIFNKKILIKNDETCWKIDKNYKYCEICGWNWSLIDWNVDKTQTNTKRVHVLVNGYNDEK